MIIIKEFYSSISEYSHKTNPYGDLNSPFTMWKSRYKYVIKGKDFNNMEYTLTLHAEHNYIPDDEFFLTLYRAVKIKYEESSARNVDFDNLELAMVWDNIDGRKVNILTGV